MLEDDVQNDGIGAETISEPAVETQTSENQTGDSAAAAAVVPEPNLREKLEQLATKKSDSESQDPAAFAPNVKFKVLDKEHEIPEEFRALMKDANSEKKVREIFEKAYGLDGIKANRDSLKEEVATTKQENIAIKGSIDGLRSIYQGAVESGNFLKLDDFFARLKIPEQHILQYALAKVNLGNLPPEQQAAIRAQIDSDRRAETTELQARESFGREQQMASQLMNVQLEMQISRPDIKQIADAFDARIGKPGAFRQQVVNHGQLTWLQSKVDLSPEQAVQQVVQSLGLQANSNQAAMQADSQQAAAATQKVIVRETKSIPNMQGRSSSPLKVKPRNLEDLKALSKQAQAAEA